MNVKQIRLNRNFLRRCVSLVSHHDPYLVPPNTIEQEVDIIIKHTLDIVRRDPKGVFDYMLTSVGKCIQVTFVKVYDETLKKYRDDIVQCTFTVQPIIVGEDDDIDLSV